MIAIAEAATTGAKNSRTPMLINDALLLIHDALSRAKNPAILCSFGKDSMLLLHMVRRFRPDIPVLYFRGFEHPTKHDFADSMIDSLNLNVAEAVPFATDVVARDSHIEVIEEYRLNETTALYFPIEPEPNHAPSPESLCAVEKINQPVVNKPLGFDCVFQGSRADDVDPVHGPMTLKSNKCEANGVTFVYPLKDWTEAMVWEASELLGVRQNEARYNRKEMSANADYWPMCCECLKPGDGDTVICPKYNDRVFRLGNYFDLERRREDWRRKFINLEGGANADA